MSLDDRLRSAYRQNLEDVRQRVEPTVARGPEPDRKSLDNLGPDLVVSGTRGSLPIRIGGTAIAAAIVVLGGIGLFRLVSDQDVELVGTDAANEGSLADGSVLDGGAADDAVGEPAAATDDDDQPLVVEDDGQSDPEDVAPQAESDPSPGAGAETPSDTEADAPTTVCPSGLRARLEAAELSYVGANQGWGRKDDLVDEQDGPYYFEAWEPNHELPVTVEVALDQPVLAADIRVHQDPFIPVSGTITVSIPGTDGEQEFGIDLSGTDGWRVHTFDEPITIERFTIRRETAQANIMEVMVCLPADPGS